jgi:hypothetical protein
VAEGGGMKGLLIETAREYNRAIRLMTMRSVLAETAPIQPRTLIALIVLSIGVSAAFDATQGHLQENFTGAGLLSNIAWWPVFVGLVCLISWRTGIRPWQRALADVTALLTAGTAFLALLSSIGAIGISLLPHVFAQAPAPPIGKMLFLWLAGTAGGWLLWILLPLAMIVGLVRAGRRLWPSDVRAKGTRLLFAACVPVFLIPTHSGTWPIWSVGEFIATAVRQVQEFEKQAAVNEEDDQESDPDKTDYEKLIYAQTSMVRDATQALSPSVPGKPRFYFVGAAPTDADVFRHELIGAKNVFDKQFGTTGRSLILMNSLVSAELVPLATATNLEHVLAEVGGKMDREADVLVMFISTNGSKSGGSKNRDPESRLGVEMPGFTLNQITPERLARMLDRSGIKHRVVILSASHSGGFIPALANSHTLVMAAAHADRASPDHNEDDGWTLFGDMLFERALTATRSLPEAFAKASAHIGAWEKEQKLQPSEPQISIGEDIRRKLEAMDVGPEKKRTP